VLKFADLEGRMRKAPLVAYDQYKQAPPTSGIYTAWLEGETRCLYVGKAGNSSNGNLQKRIRSHFSGQRASDRFCLYVYDTYLHEERCHSEAPMTTLQVNQMTANWIREQVKFRWIVLNKDECDSAERDFKRKWHPILNPS